MFERGRIVDTAGRVLFPAATRPLGYWARLRGLIGRAALTDDEAWWFTRCSAVHSLGMCVPIDVVHMDAGGRVLRIRAALRPARFSIAWHGRQVMELAAGAAARLGLQAGQSLRFET